MTDAEKIEAVTYKLAGFTVGQEVKYYDGMGRYLGRAFVADIGSQFMIGMILLRRRQSEHMGAWPGWWINADLVRPV